LEPESDKELVEKYGLGGLFTGVLLAPAAWAVNLQANYTLVTPACAYGWKFAMYISSFLTLALALCGAYIANRNWSRAGRLDPDHDETAGTLSSARMLSFVGLILSLFFALLIVAQSLPLFIYDPCR
jgi:hypothetical protein